MKEDNVAASLDPKREARKKRIAEQAQLEKAALTELDRAARRLAAAEARRDETVAEAEVAVAAARDEHDRALAVFARHAGPERASRLLGLYERDLRRLAKETAG
jgi:hypothetical protein